MTQRNNIKAQGKRKCKARHNLIFAPLRLCVKTVNEKREHSLSAVRFYAMDCFPAFVAGQAVPPMTHHVILIELVWEPKIN